jgi:probable rRNA maturation factor
MMSGASISIARTVRGGWTPTVRDLRQWADAVLGRAAAGREVSVLLVGLRRSRTLNARYRGHDKSTNVLSFPAPAIAARSSGNLGDLVICPQVLRDEAWAQNKDVRAHWAHMVVHGVLHLLGYDHQHGRDAQRMERREVRVLRSLGIANPYIIRPTREHG